MSAYGGQFMETANIRNGINLDLFRILVESDGPKSASELAEITKADPVLLGMEIATNDAHR